MAGYPPAGPDGTDNYNASKQGATHLADRNSVVAHLASTVEGAFAAASVLGLEDELAELISKRATISLATAPRRGSKEANKSWRGQKEEDGGSMDPTKKNSPEEHDTELSSSILKVKDAVSSLRRSGKPKE